MAKVIMPAKLNEQKTYHVPFELINKKAKPTVIGMNMSAKSM